MAPKKPYLVTPTPIPIENVSLGRLVPDITNVTQDAFTTPYPQAEDCQIAQQDSYKSLISKHKKTSVRAHLIALGFDLARDLEDKRILDAMVGKVYELREPTAWSGLRRQDEAFCAAAPLRLRLRQPSSGWLIDG